jgi:hypothetical protein
MSQRGVLDFLFKLAEETTPLSQNAPLPTGTSSIPPVEETDPQAVAAAELANQVDLSSLSEQELALLAQTAEQMGAEPVQENQLTPEQLAALGGPVDAAQTVDASAPESADEQATASSVADKLASIHHWNGVIMGEACWDTLMKHAQEEAGAGTESASGSEGTCPECGKSKSECSCEKSEEAKTAGAKTAAAKFAYAKRQLAGLLLQLNRS